MEEEMREEEASMDIDGWGDDVRSADNDVRSAVPLFYNMPVSIGQSAI
jgi:hypothetical protein